MSDEQPLASPEERADEARRLRARILDVMPAATYQMDRFLSLVDLAFSRRCRSACVEVTQERLLRVLLYTQWASFDVGRIRQALTWDKGIRLDFGFDVIRDAGLAGRASRGPAGRRTRARRRAW